MENTIIEQWQYKTKIDNQSLVIPDGCRDVLLWSAKGKRPRLLITSLDEKSYYANIKAGDYLHGFRLKAGTKIDEAKLFGALEKSGDNLADIEEKIRDFTTLSVNVKQALDCLASGVNSVNDAAVNLGVSNKTLQRIISKNTGRTPASWLCLARVRKSARVVGSSINLAQSAIAFGYSDQSHMNREFKRWLNITPAKINNEPEILEQLKNSAYC